MPKFMEWYYVQVIVDSATVPCRRGNAQTSIS